MWFGFLGMIGRNNTKVCGFATLGNSGYRDEVNGVGARNIAVALGQSMNFVGIALSLEMPVATLTELLIFSKASCVGVKGITM